MSKKKAASKVNRVEDAMGIEVIKKDSRVARVNRCGTLLRNQVELDEVLEAAKLGSSLATIEAMVGLNEGTLRTWLEKGKDEKEKTYHAFRKMFLKAAAQARMVAEGLMLQKNPERWLDRNSAARELEQEVVVEQGGSGSKGGLVIAEKLMEAVGVLLAQGYSMEEIVRSQGKVVDGHIAGRLEE